MKKDIFEYMAKCMECKKVTAENNHLAILLQPFPISEWKREVVTIDSITKFKGNQGNIIPPCSGGKVENKFSIWQFF